MNDILPRWFNRNLEAALQVLPVTLVIGLTGLERNDCLPLQLADGFDRTRS